MSSDGPSEDQLIIHQIGGGKRKKRRGLSSLLIYLVAGVIALGVVGAVVVGGMQMKTERPTPVGVASLAAAESCLREHDLPCAEEDFRAYLAKYPGDPHATALLAITLTQDGQHTEALPYYRKAEALGVETYDFDANYATSLEATGHLDQAIQENYAALRIVPSLVDVRGSLANELVRKSRAPEAVNLLQTFDQSLVDRGEPPYFSAQIDRIKSKMGGAAAVEAASSAAANNATVANDVGAKTDGPAGVTLIPLTAQGGTLYVPVIVDDVLPLNFVVDSGASDVVIPENIARELMQKGKLTRSDYRGSGYAVLADGSRRATQAFNIRSLKVGPHTLRNVTATITPVGGSLLLGQSFLRRFKSWSIDNRRRVLVLEE